MTAREWLRHLRTWPLRRRINADPVTYVVTVVDAAGRTLCEPAEVPFTLTDTYGLVLRSTAVDLEVTARGPAHLEIRRTSEYGGGVVHRIPLRGGR